jgi:hypothetical protein
MSARKKLTPQVVPQIRRWLDQGLSPRDIAENIGCTLGTLRVRCSQLGISLRRDRNLGKEARAIINEGSPCADPHADLGNLGLRGPMERFSHVSTSQRQRTALATEILTLRREELVVLIPQITLYELRNSALVKGISASALATRLLEKIVQDDLYDAVLDDN